MQEITIPESTVSYATLREVSQLSDPEFRINDPDWGKVAELLGGDLDNCYECLEEINGGFLFDMLLDYGQRTDVGQNWELVFSPSGYGMLRYTGPELTVSPPGYVWGPNFEIQDLLVGPYL